MAAAYICFVWFIIRWILLDSAVFMSADVETPLMPKLIFLMSYSKDLSEPGLIIYVSDEDNSYSLIF
jgi:hypothetical protein